MCGRFAQATPPDEIARYFDADPPEAALEANYNVAPTTDVYAVLEDGSARKVEALHWGLVPVWAEGLSVGNRMINARAETVATKNAYRHAFRKRRCIIPADGFYEWRKEPGAKRKQPFFIHRRDGEPFAFAGLWEVWRGPPDRRGTEEVRSCAIVTGEPNEVVRPIHDRMPVVLPPSAWDTWLDPDQHDLDVLGKLLVPAPASLVEAYPVSTEVNSVRNRGAHLLERVDPATGERSEGSTGGQGSLL